MPKFVAAGGLLQGSSWSVLHHRLLPRQGIAWSPFIPEPCHAALPRREPPRYHASPLPFSATVMPKDEALAAIPSRWSTGDPSRCCLLQKPSCFACWCRHCTLAIFSKPHRGYPMLLSRHHRKPRLGEELPPLGVAVVPKFAPAQPRRSAQVDAPSTSL